MPTCSAVITTTEFLSGEKKGVIIMFIPKRNKYLIYINESGWVKDTQKENENVSGFTTTNDIRNALRMTMEELCDVCEYAHNTNRSYYCFPW